MRGEKKEKRKYGKMLTLQGIWVKEGYAGIFYIIFVTALNLTKLKLKIQSTFLSQDYRNIILCFFLLILYLTLLIWLFKHPDFILDKCKV